MRFIGLFLIDDDPTFWFKKGDFDSADDAYGAWLDGESELWILTTPQARQLIPVLLDGAMFVDAM
jgi:hypothetical protein